MAAGGGVCCAPHHSLFLYFDFSLVGLFMQSENEDQSDESQLSTVKTDGQLSQTTAAAAIPDLLNPRISVDSSIELHLPSSATDRLAMLGGVSGMLARMDRDKAKPDVKTFSLLLDLMPLSLEDETELLSSMDFYNVQADIDFYNMLIRERNLRRDFAGARVCYTLLHVVLLLLFICIFTQFYRF